MLVALRPSTILFINDPSKLARCAPGVEADWSPTARMQRALPAVFQFDLPFVRAARAQETNSLHTPSSCVRTRGAQDQRGWQSIPFCWASTRDQRAALSPLVPRRASTGDEQPPSHLPTS